MDNKGKEVSGNKVERMEKLMVQIAKHPNLTKTQKLNAIADVGLLIVREKFKEEEFAILKGCIEGLAKIM